MLPPHNKLKEMLIVNYSEDFYGFFFKICLSIRYAFSLYFKTLNIASFGY